MCIVFRWVEAKSPPKDTVKKEPDAICISGLAVHCFRGKDFHNKCSNTLRKAREDVKKQWKREFLSDRSKLVEGSAKLEFMKAVLKEEFEADVFEKVRTRDYSEPIRIEGE